MRYLIVIPARGGSKGIPHKNITPLGGKPLLSYTIECIKKVQFQGDIVVSTDDSSIEEIARQFSDVYIIKRPAEISGDTARTEEALRHALFEMESRKGVRYDAIVTLQVTSPLRKSETISLAMEQFAKDIESYDALLTLSEDNGDFWLKDTNNAFRRLFPNRPRRRQERAPLYTENGVLYITKRESLIETDSVLGNNPNGFVINQCESIDINEPIDLIIAESFLTKEIENE